MSTEAVSAMKVRPGDGDTEDVSPTSAYSVASMARSRPKLPQMAPCSSTLSPERKASGEGEGTSIEDLERDLDSLRNTDFASKYGRRIRASGTTSPAGSSRPMSPSLPGSHPTIRRIESLRMKLVKVKESQDRAERASRELKNIPGRRSGVVQRPQGPFGSDSQRWERESKSAESIQSTKDFSSCVDDSSHVEQQSFSEPLNRTSAHPSGSMPMTPSVINDQHYTRAWSEPMYCSPSCHGIGDDDDDDDEPIHWKQENTRKSTGVYISNGTPASNSVPQQSSDSTEYEKSMTFSPLSYNPDCSTLSETQSKNNSCSVLKDASESVDDPSKTLSEQTGHIRPVRPEKDQLIGSVQDASVEQTYSTHVITNRDPTSHVRTELPDQRDSPLDHFRNRSQLSGTPEGVVTTDNSEEQKYIEDSEESLSHDFSQRISNEIISPTKEEGQVSESSPEFSKRKDEGLRPTSDKDTLLHANFSNQDTNPEILPKCAPSEVGAFSVSVVRTHHLQEGNDSEKPSRNLCKSENVSTDFAAGKMANGSSVTQPHDSEVLTKEPSLKSVKNKELTSLHDSPSAQEAPPLREPTSQVMVGLMGSPRNDSTKTSGELTTNDDEAEESVEEFKDSEILERKNGKSLKQKSKSDPSGEKCKETHTLSTVVGSQSQSTSELDKSDQGLDFHQNKQCDDQLSKSDELRILDVFDVKRNVDSKHKIVQGIGSVFSRGAKMLTEDTRRPSSGDSATEQEARTAPSSPQTQSPTGTLQHPIRMTSGTPSPLLQTESTGASSLFRSVSSASSLLSKRPRDLNIGTRHHRPAIADFLSGQQNRVFGSTLSLMDTPAKEKRELIVEELVETERQYVETLQRLVDTYMIPMKSHSFLDSKLVDDIFYKINEISTHHAMFLAFLEQALQYWDNSSSTIGDVIQEAFSRETVQQNYTSFIENFPRAEKALDELMNKTNFQKFLEQCERETRSKLPLKAQIVKPAQRIPRYELLLRRLIENTPHDHPDYKQLLRAEGTIHEVALRINSVKESKHEESLQETLRTLEFLLVTELVGPERLYHRHDMVQILSRKDQCCIWLFSDLAVLTSIKRKSGPVNRRATLLLKSPAGQDFVENVKHKVWLKVPLDDVEIVKGAATFSQKQLVDRDQLDYDLTLMTQISELSRKLKGPHQCLEDAIHEMMSQINKQLSEHQLKAPPPDTCRVQLLATTHEGVTNITVVFPSPEKKSSWESAFTEIKQKLASLSDGKPPEFLQALQITKTRAGMQFSCAAPIEGLNASQQRDVWVCNSDGYVGHMCLLSLQPEPIVTLNTPVPGCNSRILCICAVPAFHGSKRKASQQRPSKVQQPQSTSPVTIHVESFEGGNEDGEESLSDLSSSTSDQGSDDDDSTLHIHTRVKSSGRSRSPSLSRSESSREVLLDDPYKSTMWLGTEDGCIHIFLCTDNIKTTKNKVKMQQNAGVLCIIHMDQKVFVSLDNGELVVYRRSQDGSWDMSMPDTINVGSATSPVTKMHPVAGRLWCACQNNIIVLNPATLCQEFQFAVSLESKRTIQCLASAGQGVWVAGQSSSKVLLYHATTYEHLLDVSITQAVAQKLQTADDIIRQHKTACLRITSLLACKDLLWIGTSAGVVLTLVMPKVSASTTRASLSQPTVTGLVHGHTGHVRFLTSVEMPCSSKWCSTLDSTQLPSHMSRRASVSLHMLTMATRMLVISGGDGYEDFRNSSSNEGAGRDDSTNHLLLWQV